MRYTTLGRTGLETSTIGIGLEHLLGQPRETVVSTIRQAVERGVTYFDVVYSIPDYLDDVGAGFREYMSLPGHRDRLLLTAHLGSTSKDGQYAKTRTLKRCEAAFQDVLERLGTGHVDVMFLHNFNTAGDWERSSPPRASRRPTGLCRPRRPPARHAARARRAAPSASTSWRGSKKPPPCSSRDGLRSLRNQRCVQQARGSDPNHRDQRSFLDFRSL
jgi:hypothetical protein